MQTKEHNPTPKHPAYIKDLLLLFSIPLAIAALAAALVYIPRAAASPTYDFVYAYCPDYQCTDSYTIDANGRVTKKTTEKKDAYDYRPASQLKYYDASQDATRTVSLEDVKSYDLLNSSKSPDGYKLVNSNSENGGFLFWGNGENTWQLENGWKKRPVEVSSTPSYYSNNVTFLGWVR